MFDDNEIKYVDVINYVNNAKGTQLWDSLNDVITACQFEGEEFWIVFSVQQLAYVRNKLSEIDNFKNPHCKSTQIICEVISQYFRPPVLDKNSEESRKKNGKHVEDFLKYLRRYAIQTC